MRVLKVNEDNELVRENGDFVWLYDGDAIVQLIRQRLQVFKGEWFMNVLLGVDYFGVIFPSTSSDFTRYIEIKRVVESVPGVTKLISLTIELENATTRSYRFIMDIEADYGTIVFNDVFNVA